MRKLCLAATLLMATTLPAWGDPERTAERREYPTLKILGFGNFDFYDRDNADGTSESGFREGQFVLHFASRLSERFSFFGEISLTARSDEFSTEVERAFVKLDQSDHLSMAFGRFHTALSWWNMAYHHGAWLQTTIDRPFPIRFGSQFIPIHFVGVVADGAIPSGAAGLGYVAGVGNGRGDNIGRGGDAGDVNNSRALLAKILARPDRPYGLEVGASYYVDEITQEMAEDFDETVLSGYVVYDRESPQIIAEYFKLQRTGITTGERYDSDAYYVQVAYRIHQWKGRAMPYARYERTDVADDEPVFTVDVDRKEALAGVRFDVSAYVAVKAEYRRTKIGTAPYGNGFYAQIAYAF